MSTKNKSKEINLKDIWDKREFYEGFSENDIKKLEELDFTEWLARSNIIDEVIIGELLRSTGIIKG